MTYPPEWPAPGKMHFRLLHDRLGRLDLDCDHGYVVTAYDLGFPDIRNVSINNSLDHGTFDVTRFFGARAVSLDVTLKPHTGLTPASSKIAPESMLRDKLTGYLYPGIRPTLVFSEHGDNRVRQILLRGDSASFAVSRPDYNELNVSWIAPRGTFASYDERCYLYRFSETSGEFIDLTVVNEGTVPVDWRASISGYSVHPTLILNGTETLAIEYDAEPGDVIILDSFSRTITINGVPASYSYLGDASHWFQIPPGVSTLSVRHAGGVSAYGYPYARWQVPSTGAGITDAFERADGPLGANWVTPSSIPAGTVAVPLEIDAGAVIVTEPDDGTDPHEWGFARHVTDAAGTVGTAVEIDVSNLAQSSTQGPTARSKAELYTNKNDTDAACQALSVDFDYGIMPTPVAPLVLQDPFETLTNWEVAGINVALVPGRTGKAVSIGASSLVTYDIAPASRSSTVIIGAAVRIYSKSAALPGNRTLFELRGNLGATLHTKVVVGTDGAISLYGGADVFVAAVSPAGTITPNTWHYVEVRYVLAEDGECSLRVNGLDVVSAFNVDTAATVGATCDQIRLPAVAFYDDLYLATSDDAAFIGPLTVPSGSLAWEMHQYGTDGTSAHTVASGAQPYDYTATTTLRFESGIDGTQRFILDGEPVAEAVEDTPIVGPYVGFGANWETFEYPPELADFSDDFERGALGADWVLPVARATGRTMVLPTISTGAAVTAGHTGNYPQQVYSTTNTGATLVGGVAQTMPSQLSAGYMVIARVLQSEGGVAHTASEGWTMLGVATQGVAGGDFMESFENYGAWTTVGTATTVAGRTGNAARLTGAGSSNHADYRLPTEDATVVVGFAHQISSLVAATSEIVQFYSDTNFTQHNRVTVATNGSLSFWRGTTNLGTSAAGVIAINTWNYIEVRATLSDTVGAATIRVNGTDVLTLTNVNTKNAGTATVYDTIRLCGPIASMFNTFDDLYVLTGAGAAFKGNQTIPVSSGIEFLRMTAFARLCDGTSKDALTLTGAAKEWVSQIESYWLQPPAGSPTNTGFAGTDIISRLKFAAASGVTGFADPPAIDLGTTNRDWMFVVCHGADVQSFPSMSGPPSYSTMQSTLVSPSTLCAMRTAYRTATLGVTENPAPTTGLTGRPWVAFTIGIPGGDLKWGGAENAAHLFDASDTITVEAEVAGTATSSMVEMYTHMVSGSSACRGLQIDMGARTWRMGHFTAGGDVVIAASDSLPVGASPYTIRLEGDPDGTERFLFNGSLVQEILDVGAPTPTAGARVGFGEFWTTNNSPSPQVRSFTATGVKYSTAGPPTPATSPRIERFHAAPMAGTAWAIPGRVIISYDPTKPRPDAPPITAPPEFAAGLVESPFGADLVEFQSDGRGLAIYADGFVYDGKGWRGPSGDATDWAGGQLGPSTTDPQRPRHDAPNVMEDEIPATSPLGAPFRDFRTPDDVLWYAVYMDGYSFDGRGWRDAAGRATYDDGVVVTKAPLDVFPANNPPPGGRPPWAWTPPVDPITGEPSILTVHFCYYDQWI